MLVLAGHHDLLHPLRHVAEEHLPGLKPRPSDGLPVRAHPHLLIHIPPNPPTTVSFHSHRALSSSFHLRHFSFGPPRKIGGRVGISGGRRFCVKGLNARVEPYEGVRQQTSITANDK
eukprot:8791626-Pyramimonas_sp.AAC.1